MKGLSALFCFAIFGSYSLVLTQVLAPGFSHEGLNVSFRVCSITK